MMGGVSDNEEAMRENDIREDLQDGFELGPAPAVGPDGVPVVPPVRKFPPPRPRLCEAGPCLSYHCFQVQLDAEDPRARKVEAPLPDAPGVQQVPGGAVYTAPAAFHVETHHYCYPTPGVATRLGSLPIVNCNRWHPITPFDWKPDAPMARQRDMDRSSFMASPEGVAYRQAVAEWEAARAAEQAEAEEMERLIAESLASPSVSPPRTRHPSPTEQGDL